MRSRLITHRCTHWLAIFVVWFAALAPTLSQAFTGSASARLVEICTAAGFVSVAVDGGSAPGAPSQPVDPHHALGEFEHCPFCFLQGHAPVLPSQPVALIAPTGLRYAVPRLFLQAARTSHAWAPAQARAPPLSA